LQTNGVGFYFVEEVKGMCLYRVLFDQGLKRFYETIISTTTNLQLKKGYIIPNCHSFYKNIETQTLKKTWPSKEEQPKTTIHI
jgi:hypothetical protein